MSNRPGEGYTPEQLDDQTSGTPLPGSVIVCGGASATPKEGTFSAAYGPTLEDADSGVPHGQISFAPIEDIIDSGGEVEIAPELTRGGNMNKKHVNITPGPNGEVVFTGPIDHPVPKNERIL